MSKDYTPELLLGCVVLVGLDAVTQSELPNLKVIFAGTVVAIGVSVIAKVDTKLGNAFAGLIFFAMCVHFLVESNLLEKLGFSGGVTTGAMKDYPNPVKDKKQSKQGNGGSATPQTGGGVREA